MRYILLTTMLIFLLAACTQAPVEETELPEQETEEIEQTEDTEENVEEEPSTEENNQEATEGDEETRAEEPATERLTQEEAIEELKAHLEIFYDEEVRIIVDREEGGKFVIQVFDVIGGEGDTAHTQTRGWYTVDRKTGEVESMF
ncbi:hypothetical protein [Halalkalibacter krulwichiae]|uniref:PepSY domain-containing protein n=1 Tax=Halalkalibacter krulwichiae TaxID=199441 RepID=A0A1X9MIF0_9BACI|nr:hypothetical protein [Halalkalibacter krulwichiae]ARK32480.1 hypothetical protein BkAM31D_22895 [Halalkalibacter krulwichiae]